MVFHIKSSNNYLQVEDSPAKNQKKEKGPRIFLTYRIPKVKQEYVIVEKGNTI